MEEKLNDQMLIRRGKLEKIAALGFEPYGGKYECTYHSEDIMRMRQLWKQAGSMSKWQAVL